MRFTPLISQNATVDVINAKQYYEEQLSGLGRRFANEVEIAIERICTQPLSFSLRYKNVRGVKLNSFPYVVYYMPDTKAKTATVLRIFNTHQKPTW